MDHVKKKGSTPKMKIVLYVHDLFMEIGHSKALIETIRHLPKDEIESITVIAFSSDDLKKLFSPLDCPMKIVRVPFPNLYPFILKMIFYYIWSFGYTKLILDSNSKKIGVGISALCTNYINIQFVHQHWEKFYFTMVLTSKKNIKYFYKRILFYFFRLLENYHYHKKGIHYSSLSQYTTDYLKERFLIDSDRITTNYSGIDIEKFSFRDLTRSQIYNSLLSDYPELSQIDPTQPIYLFVGAYERKGLQLILEQLEERPGTQFIVIGKPESGQQKLFSKKLKLVTIDFTKKVNLFYQLADAFVFASVYEPFGLVIIEAAAMGMEMYVTRRNVGAVEILENLDGIHIFNDSSDFKIGQQKVLSNEDKIKFRNGRIDRLKEYSWEKTALNFYKILRS